jgi:hypothetical protein
MRVAYGLIAFAVIFFFLGLAGCPFPLGDGIKRREKRHDRDFGLNHDLLAPSSFAQPRSEIREALDVATGTAELGEALSLFEPTVDARPLSGGPDRRSGERARRRHTQVKHSWCVKCGFPFVRPRSTATCDVDRENWCDKRAHTPVAERERRTILHPNTPYRVHPMWADEHPDPQGNNPDWWTN